MPASGIALTALILAIVVLIGGSVLELISMRFNGTLLPPRRDDMRGNRSDRGGSRGGQSHQGDTQRDQAQHND